MYMNIYIYIYIYSSTYIEVRQKIKQGSEILSKCGDLKRSYPFPWKIAVGPAIPVTSRFEVSHSPLDPTLLATASADRTEEGGGAEVFMTA